ncbi:MAG TPA: hypothetical protein VH234_00995 [Candidatus Saccharimonadales bacterium]|jgi:hypothetical protein|nr:hypothetical protein [Candidatus Saccharimonadales bacterium]
MKLSQLSKIEILTAISIVVGLTSSVAGIGATIASADSPASTTQSSTLIARSVVRSDKLQAMAGALNLTTAQVQTDLKTHNLKQVIANAGLTQATFRQKVQAQLTSELQGQGYSQTQIDNALQHYQSRSQHRQNQ